MVDKALSNVYIWYSGATNITGEKLVEALGCKGGRKKPTLSKHCMVIGWGAKTKDTVSLGKLPVMNHPDKIRDNRNKFKALQAMAAANVNVAPFTNDAGAIGNGDVILPVIGRRNYHQGGKGFWSCPTMSHVQAAISEEKGAQYFQNLIEIKDEYRLHTFNGKVIHAVKKVKRSIAEMEAAYVEDELARQRNIAETNNEPFDEAAVTPFLRRQAKKFCQDGANMLIRSNRLGWKFSRVTKYHKDLEPQSAKALKALGLTFGAVDACVDVNGKVWIIEVNTGPGLEATTFDRWVEKFREEIDAVLNPKSLLGKAKAAVSKRKAPAAKAAAENSGGAKTDLQKKMELMQEMVAAADDEEAAVLDKVFGKMFQ